MFTLNLFNAPINDKSDPTVNGISTDAELDTLLQGLHSRLLTVPERVESSLSDYGWSITEDGGLKIEWDTEEHVLALRNQVQHLIRGCKCKKGCQNNQCGCRRKQQNCGPGCLCLNCCNSPNSADGGNSVNPADPCSSSSQPLAIPSEVSLYE